MGWASAKAGLDKTGIGAEMTKESVTTVIHKLVRILLVWLFAMCLLYIGVESGRASANDNARYEILTILLDNVDKKKGTYTAAEILALCDSILQPQTNMTYLEWLKENDMLMYSMTIH